MGWIAWNSSVFLARTASASNEIGGSIAIMARSWNRWFGTMSRNAPVCFVEAAAALDADGLGGRDLNVVDMVAVPERLEDAVGEAQHQDVLDRFLAEEVIDPVDLVFGQHLEDLRVEGLGRGKVVPERLFDDHPPPCFVRLSGETGAAELLDDRAKEPVGDCQIEQHIGRAVLLPALLGQQLLEPAKGFGLREIAAHIMHAPDEP